MDTVVSPLGELSAFVEGSTPDRILLAAGQLFSTRGFHGTSTREIAAAVGIRQPSLFHHFASKTSIAQHLFEFDRLNSPVLRRRIGNPEDTLPVRFYEAIRDEMVVVTTSRYDLRSLYLFDLLDEEPFAFWRGQYELAVAHVTDLLLQGMERGEFVREPPHLVAHLFEAVMMQVVRWGRDRPADFDPARVAGLMVRSILVQPDDLPLIRLVAGRPK